MKVYVNPVDFKCHTANDGTFLEFDVPFFDDKCQTLIEGYRYVPPGESWTREDGAVFRGEMIAPATDYAPLGIAQTQYALDMAEAAASYRKGVESI